MSTRVRLPLLLACLAVALVALLGVRTSVFSSASPGRNAPWSPCQAAEPRLAHVPLGQLAKLRTSLLPVVDPLARSRYMWGVVTPEDVWSDGYPKRFGASVMLDGSYPGSFEMRVWAWDRRLKLANVDTVADVFQFADAADAQRFFDAASSTRCHRYGRAQLASQPPDARNLTWDNPDGATQIDVFLLRGVRVYRASEAPPVTSHPAASERAAIATVNILACRLAEASCRGGAARASAPS